ncbi:NO-inducible flavohemoprotein [Carnimonas nigrificans]|uniref:NO-inducible flavohemoprotein n=1 Tax=Carnimonas nigrificans TaxID=64323 RepID=UPI0004723022|nr:NO-inducible flavohemoprotein [Carnimonas nigrificans]
MLTEQQRDIVKSTVPLLESGGETLARHFYQIMLEGYPEVRPLFNQTNQATGRQPRALANSVLQYAKNIDHLDQLDAHLVGTIVNKHVALQVLPEHYPIVGTCLLQAIRDVLGEEVATDEVIEAWKAAYQQLADILIGLEAQKYDALEAAPGGWRGDRAFRVVRKVPESAEITSFYLEPVDGKPVINFQPGQFIGLRIVIDGKETRRNYSISSAPNGASLRVSIKREGEGAVSNYLHDHIDEGDTLDLFPPAGEFVLNEDQRPLVLISGGVGITPTLSMAEAELQRGQRKVVFIHYARNANVDAFRSTLEEWRERYANFQLHVVYEESQPSDLPQPDAVGRPDKGQLEAWLPENRDVDVYFLGPEPFMAFIKKALKELGVPEEQTQYEFFGPEEALN